MRVRKCGSAFPKRSEKRHLRLELNCLRVCIAQSRLSIRSPLEGRPYVALYETHTACLRSHAQTRYHVSCVHAIDALHTYCAPILIAVQAPNQLASGQDRFTIYRIDCLALSHVSLLVCLFISTQALSSRAVLCYTNHYTIL